MTILSDRLNDAAQAIVETRDFCGNENDALNQWQDDNGKLSPAERAQVRAMADDLWRKSQLDAGVSVPLSKEERAKAYRGIEQG